MTYAVNEIKYQSGIYIIKEEVMIRRHTIQKELVLNAILRMRRLVTADEVLKFIRRKHPTIGRSTIYRNLGFLVEEGLIRRVNTETGPDRYAITSERPGYVRCVDCDRLFKVEMDMVEDLCKRIRDTRGFEFLDHDIIFRGICPDCLAKEESQ